MALKTAMMIPMSTSLVTVLPARDDRK